MVSESSGMLGSAEIDRRMGYHPATAETIPLHEEARARFVALACWLDTALPPGRDLAETHTQLQHALWAANATIACNLAPLEDPAARVSNPLVQQMALNQHTKTLTVGVAVPDGIGPEQVVAIVTEELLARLQRSTAEQSPRGFQRVIDAPQA